MGGTAMVNGGVRRRPALYPLLAAVLVLATRGTDAQPTSDLPRLVADSVKGLVDGLSLVVAQEDFTYFKWPKKTVRSYVWLPRYPGSDRHLLLVRDVTHVDGTPVAGRGPQRFHLEPSDNPDQRALEIARDGNQHVPAVLNPFWAVGVLQAAYQPRFRLTETDAGREWPSAVKALAFRETSKPTLLKTGADGKADAPVKGKVWIDTTTGRILRTELDVSERGKVTSIVTKYDLDERLQLIVPTGMSAATTEGSLGSATYSDVRLYSVTTTPGPGKGR